MAVAAGMGCRRSVRSVRGKTIRITALVISLAPKILMTMTLTMPMPMPMLLLLLPRFHEALSPAQRRELVLRSRIRTGMRLSGEAGRNITAAEEACAVWEKVLRPRQNRSRNENDNENENTGGMSPDVLALSRTLYASCLVRVGRDAEAVAVYDSCLEDCCRNAAREGANNEASSAGSRETGTATATSTSTSTATWRLSKARCLQRLLRYSSAAVEYERVVADLRHGTSSSSSSLSSSSSSSGLASTATTRDDRTEAKLGAATCILRSTGDVPRARRALDDESGESGGGGGNDNDNDNDDDDASLSERSARLLSIALGYLETGATRETIEQLKDALDNGTGDDASTRPCFLLYRWILGALEEADVEVQVDAKAKTEAETEIRHDRPRSDSEPAATLAMTPEQLFLELIRINTSPLDDPHLLRLDDKIQLHQLLTHNNNNNNGTTWPSYWPEGIVLPDALRGNESRNEILRLMTRQTGDKPTTSRLWISKTRAGYGSHGNQILTTAEAEETVRAAATKAVEQHRGRETLSSRAAGAAAGASSSSFATGAVEQERGESFLLQQMVDTLVLLRGFKFSLRIYVVVFSLDEAYISSKGLVKLASRPLVGNNNEEPTPEHFDPLDPSMHMTNSGRETRMEQEDLDVLWNELDRAAGGNDESGSGGEPHSDGDKTTTVSDNGGPPSSELWSKIRRVAADVVLVRYPERTSGLERRDPDPSEREEQRRVWGERRTEWGIPKILGLDFVIQDGREPVPWLVEVNRFPGLEPRDAADRAIKYRVVGDAWKKASELRRQRQLGELSWGGTESAVGFDDALFDLLSANGGDDSDSSLERLEF